MKTLRHPYAATAICLCLGLSALAIAAASTPLTLTIRSEKGNADHGSVLFGYIWQTPVDYSEDLPVDCDSLASEQASRCIVKLDVAGVTSTDAHQILVRIKAKAFANASHLGPAGYCQIAIAGTNEQALANNYFIHAEVWGGSDDASAQRRNVEYTEAMIAVDRPIIEVTKEIVGECEVEFAIYLEGQVVRRSMIAQLARNVASLLPTGVLDVIRRML